MKHDLQEQVTEFVLRSSRSPRAIASATS